MIGPLAGLLVVLGTATAADPAPRAPQPPASVRRTLATGVVIDWTRLRLEVEASATDPNRVNDPRPLEQEAISAIEGRFAAALDAVPARPDSAWGRLGEERPAVPSVPWRVTETRYHTSGRVEVVGALDLREAFAAWSNVRAVQPPSDPVIAATGALIDARGLFAQPCYAPTVKAVAGDVLFDAVLWKDLAWDTAPVVWVADPMHPSASVVGATPELFLASAADGCVIELEDVDAARFQARVAGTRSVGAGAVVIVVDP